MNAVEIEQAISELAEKPFDRREFPFQFLEAFGNKDATLKRLRSGHTNKSDLGGVLQTNNIHIATCDAGQVPANQGLKQAIIVVPEKSIGSSFADEPLSKFGFWADWKVEPRWNLCNSPGTDGGKVNSVGAFLESGDRVLVCTHATFRFAVDRFGVEAFDDRLIAVDEFHHVSANPDNKLGAHLGAFIAAGSGACRRHDWQLFPW